MLERTRIRELVVIGVFKGDYADNVSVPYRERSAVYARGEVGEGHKRIRYRISRVERRRDVDRLVAIGRVAAFSR
ncbi:hypothetical protein EVAR_31477_1 [Eumeta japonica]|uniref:Uncharacterized protein n=1 Tax=Eumeta variegata TaxID=151549 RepID=A0A4C1WCS3_EUMVA|nr:hypothetical protein EVAR_31477_1 [Eumeta japonica]